MVFPDPIVSLPSILRRLTWPVLLALTLTITGCGGGGSGDDGPSTLRIAVIPKGTTHSFWKAIHAGAAKAEAELTAAGRPAEIIWKGPILENDRSSQITVLESFIAQQVDGIVLAPLDRKALVPGVDAAAQIGIPLVIIDSGIDTDSYVSFAATDNFRGGQLAGERLAELLKGEGSVIMLRYSVGSASTEARESGFLDAIEAYPGIEVISSGQYAGPTRDTALTAAQNLLNRYQGQFDGVFASNESAATGMLLALRSAGLAGDVAFVGFDAGDQLIDGLETGHVQGLVVQDPFQMGYLGVKLVVDAIDGERVERRIDTGAVLVTPENRAGPDIQAKLFPPIDEYLD
ncbi:MAG: substrate-binding domain-containing protein [Opitutales bacterium]